MKADPATDPIDAKYAALGGPRGVAGSPAGPEHHLADGVGLSRQYQHGSIYWSPASGADEVNGSIRDKWIAMGGIQSVLGYPTSDEAWGANNSRFSNFQNGAIYWTFANGADQVHGAIFQHWNSLGREAGKLGLPTQDEAATQGGRFSRFQYGMIYWSPASGADEVNGSIRDKWFDLGANYKFLGFPTSDETVGANNSRFSNFQGGSIFWGYTTGAFEVHGAHPRQIQKPRPGGELPRVAPQRRIGGGQRVRYNNFQGGAIYWSSATGALTRSTARSRASGPASTGSAASSASPPRTSRPVPTAAGSVSSRGARSTGRLRPGPTSCTGSSSTATSPTEPLHRPWLPPSDVQNRTDGQAGFVAFFQHGYMTSSGNSGVTVHLY